MNVVALDFRDLAIASLLIVFDGALSVALGLGLVRQLAWATTRMTVQLLLVGLLLKMVFASASPWLTMGIVGLMMAAAAIEVTQRSERRLAGYRNLGIAVPSVVLATTLAALLAVATAIRPDPWYEPRYVIPLVGIVLGSVLNAASLSLDQMLSGVFREKAAIEARLSLGASRTLALASLVRVSIRRALMPVINQMSAAGVITLPGTMTGQMLAGMDPMEAVKYQILVMFLISGGSGLAALSAAFLAVRLVTDAQHRLRLDTFRGQS